MKRPESPQSNADGDTVASSGDTGVPPEDLPFSHGFLDNDPVTSKSRPLYFEIVGGTALLVLTYVIWGVLPIYWASIFKLYDHAHNLHGWIVVSFGQSSPYVLDLTSAICLQDHDSGAIGQTVAQTFIGGSGPATKMTWMMAPSDLNLTTREQFEHAMVDEKAWAIITSTRHPLFASDRVSSHHFQLTKAPQNT